MVFGSGKKNKRIAGLSLLLGSKPQHHLTIWEMKEGQQSPLKVVKGLIDVKKKKHFALICSLQVWSLCDNYALKTKTSSVSSYKQNELNLREDSYLWCRSAG